MVGRFHGDDPHLFIFLIQLCPSFMPHHDRIDQLFLQKKIYLSLSHLVPEILYQKLVELCTKMYYLTVFKHFVIFSLILDPIDPLFFF